MKFKRMTVQLFERLRDFLFGKRIDLLYTNSFKYLTVISGSKSGGDILPGPVPVPTSDTVYYDLFVLEDKEILVTSILTKFFFFIPFRYDEYIIEFKGNKYDTSSFTIENVMEEIYNAENWNKRGDMTIVSGYEYTEFNSITGTGATYTYEMGDNDYTHVKYK